MVGWLCFTSHRQRGHLEMAPPFTDPCEGHKARFLHRSQRETNLGQSHGSQLLYRCAKPAPQPLYVPCCVFFFADRIFMPHQPTSVYVSCFFFAERIFMPHQPTSVYVSCFFFFFAERIFMPHQPTSVYVLCCGFFFAERIFMPHQPTSVYVSCFFFCRAYIYATSANLCLRFMLWFFFFAEHTHSTSVRTDRCSQYPSLRML